MKWTSASASHILVKNKLLANSIKSNIKNYNDFRELAKEYSVCSTHKNGGYIGYFVPGEMVSEIDAAISSISSISLNKLLGPIQTVFGYHLFLIHTRKII